MMILFTGCTYPIVTHHGSFIFPGSRFVDETNTCFLATLKTKTGITSDQEFTTQLGDMYKTVGVNITNELADPFICETLESVTFQSSRPGNEIASFYQRNFMHAGWRETRGILTLEFTNCGGDWLRVFTKNSQQVLVHVCGPMTLQEDESETSFFLREITLRFRGLRPEKLLGSDFRNNERANKALQAIGDKSPQPER